MQVIEAQSARSWSLTITSITSMCGNWIGPGSTIECLLSAEGRSRGVRRDARVTLAGGLCRWHPWLSGPRLAPVVSDVRGGPSGAG
jgi:hypothetical protein